MILFFNTPLFLRVLRMYLYNYRVNCLSVNITVKWNALSSGTQRTKIKARFFFCIAAFESFPWISRSMVRRFHFLSSLFRRFCRQKKNNKRTSFEQRLIRITVIGNEKKKDEKNSLLRIVLVRELKKKKKSRGEPSSNFNENKMKKKRNSFASRLARAAIATLRRKTARKRLRKERQRRHKRKKRLEIEKKKGAINNMCMCVCARMRESESMLVIRLRFFFEIYIYI